MRYLLCLIIVISLFTFEGIAQEKNYRPGVFLREDWKEIPAAIPLTQEHVSNPELILNIYGPGSDSIKKSHHDKPVDDPFYIWSGLCVGNWGVTLKHSTSFADMTEFSRIRWRSKQAGLRQLHVILKLQDGTWLISGQADGSSSDWRITEFIINDISWYKLNIETVAEQQAVEAPDLSRVDEIGFTDLMPGGKSAACSRLDWIEVHANPVKR